MPYCPNCGAFVPSGDSTCSCGTSFILSFREDYEKLRDMYNEASSYERNGNYSRASQVYNNILDEIHILERDWDFGYGSDSYDEISRIESDARDALRRI
ncbi:hypothetical protein [Methanobrevibacter woesei]|uniref:hypothetical protein n=1 Tax=Methanobrevibacter woesei TaxID=190976 RepID=UPI0024B64CD6|nr:hypothetical protein [Methanobrevibacter woesei]